MIKSFKHKGIERLFFQGTKKGIQTKHADKLETVLDLLDAADVISVMNFPGSDLHLLQPKGEQRWAVKISGNWRITFRFQDGDAYEVDYEDYH
jgi:proteic killer suppression protein